MIEIYLKRPSGTREPKNLEDWGDSKTIGLHLKKKIIRIRDTENYGIFLGLNRIGIKNDDLEIVKIIKYNSLKEMKDVWILD